MSDQTQIYKEVALSLDNAIKASENVDLASDEDKNELQAIRDVLNNLSNEFQNDINKLEKSSEWDKFCMAFFGETNAGKSTIIEALRIIYEEESRLAEIKKQEKMFKSEAENNLSKYEDLIGALEEIQNSIEINYAPPQKEKKGFVFKFIAIGLSVGLLLGFIMGTGFGDALMGLFI